MNLTQTQRDHIAKFIPLFKSYLKASDRETDLAERQTRSDMYLKLLSPEGLSRMTELEFGQAISSLWASLMWGNKGYLVEKLLGDNPLPELAIHLRDLLWGTDALSVRFDAFRKSVKGFGAGMITEILAFVHPEQCGLWNDKARQGLILLGFEGTFPTVKKAQINGKEYEQFNVLLGSIKGELLARGVQIPDLLGVDYFLFEIWKAEWQRHKLPVPETETATATKSQMADFDHNEVIDHLLAIGQWLGFEVHKEKRIAVGAQVDAVWQAKIANLGVVTYVFEVQRHGSHDSLILNLQKAQNNPSVQRLVVVALSGEITKIRGEVASLPESFRRFVGYMDVSEVIRAFELMTELSGIINKLELVKSEFGG